MMKFKMFNKISKVSVKIQRYTAFTLAEVLIVLGIMGIIAECTIPTLVTNVQKQISIVSLKKSYSVLSQAYTSVQMDNSGSIKNLCTTNDSDCLANLFKPYLRYISLVSGIPNSTNLPNCWNNNELFAPHELNDCFVLNDGTSVDFDMEWSDCASRCADINVDVNGLKPPNKWGKDRFLFLLLEDKVIPYNINCFNGIGTAYDNFGCAYPYLYQN